MVWVCLMFHPKIWLYIFSGLWLCPSQVVLSGDTWCWFVPLLVIPVLVACQFYFLFPTLEVLCFSFVINKYVMRKYLRLCEYSVSYQTFIKYFCIPLRKFVCCVCWVVQLCPTLCKPLDCSPLGSFVYGIFQAKILEWVAMPFSKSFSCIAGGFFTCWATGKPPN